MKGHDRINSSLPDELILEIFNFLDTKPSRDSASLVCKRWLGLERLSRESIRIGASGNPDALVAILSSRFPNVRNLFIDERLSISAVLPVHYGRRHRMNPSAISPLKLHLLAGGKTGSETSSGKYGTEYCESENYCLSDSGLAMVGHGFPRLEKLSLIWCSNVTNFGLRSIADNCKALKSLDLQGCYLGDQGLAAVGKCCLQLEDLNLRFCEGLTDTGLVELAIGSGKKLKSLGIAACTKITDLSLEAVGSHCQALETLSLDSECIHNKGLLSVAKGCPILKVLKLQCINVTDEALEAVGSFCKTLEFLALYSFQRFTDKSLCAIGKGCKRLKNLTLSDCYFLSDKGLQAVAVGCSELTHLEVNGCHNIGTSGLESIGKSCMGLSELALLYCQKIGNFALSEIGKGCKLLQALHLVDCSSIGDDAICSIARGCRNLKKLHIRRCYEVGSKGIVAVGENCEFLTDLSLRFCDRIGDEALIAIGQCHSLRYLNVSGCHQIGDAGIIAIARGCPELTYLDVSVLQNLGDLALSEIGDGCPMLKDIVLSHCRQVTDIGLSYLVRSCTLLETCHMVYCPGITAGGVATVIATCAKIKKVLVEKWKVTPRTRRRAGSTISYLCIDL